MTAYDFPELFTTIERLVKSETPVDEALRRVIDYCSRVHPHPQWERIAALDVAAGLSSIQHRVASMLRESPPSAGLDGFYFGLCNLTYGADDELSEAKTTADMYMTASAYDNDDPDWACAATWRPEGYFESTYLDATYRLAYDGSALQLGNDAEYPLALAYGGLVVRHLGRSIGPDLLLGGAAARTLVVGFDSGDFICVGRVDGGGLIFSRAPERFNAP
jgi:hypothetical protein